MDSGAVMTYSARLARVPFATLQGSAFPAMQDVQTWLVLIVHGVTAPVTAVHALLFKRDPQAALGWIAVCVFFPLGGPLLYVMFGVNRVRIAARQINRRAAVDLGESGRRAAEAARAMIDRPEVPEDVVELARASTRLSFQPLVYGNAVDVLHNGEQAYPAMLDAIDSARRTLFLTTYIFQTSGSGRRFIDALVRAVKRGVDVRVIVDGVGELYSFPWASRVLRREGVRVARFLPPRLIPPAVHVNLRNHRKILVADGREAFTGGMNIGDRHLAANTANPHRVIDMHFRLRGPVVTQIEDAFLEDWGFVTGDRESPPQQPLSGQGNAICRAIVDGPVQESDRLATLLVSAVCSAHARVILVTPYFLPAPELVGALQSAALRGIRVDVLLPGKNNQPLVHWAARKMLPDLMRMGVNVFFQPPPFAHTKLFIIDDQYMLIGSANIDPRSLRLNFELGVEVFDRDTVVRVAEHACRLRQASREARVEELDQRSLPVRVRDAVAWLASPYL